MEHEWRETDRLEPDQLPWWFYATRSPILAPACVVLFPLALLARGLACLWKGGRDVDR